MNEQILQELETQLKEKYPFGIPRNIIDKATGNVLLPLTCRNEDSLGSGIPGRYKIGRNTVYPVSGVIEKIRSKFVHVAA